jgi:hypothetical protein
MLKRIKKSPKPIKFTIRSIKKNRTIDECGLKSIFVAKLIVVLKFCIVINNELTPVQNFKTP